MEEGERSRSPGICSETTDSEVLPLSQASPARGEPEVSARDRAEKFGHQATNVPRLIATLLTLSTRLIAFALFCTNVMEQPSYCFKTQHEPVPETPPTHRSQRTARSPATPATFRSTITFVLGASAGRTVDGKLCEVGIPAAAAVDDQPRAAGTSLPLGGLHPSREARGEGRGGAGREPPAGWQSSSYGTGSLTG